MKLLLNWLAVVALLALATVNAAAQKVNTTDSKARPGTAPGAPDSDPAGIESLPKRAGSESGAPTNGLELATLGGGCFWCVEAVFERLEGVQSVTSGYAGGQVANPTYEQVCSGTSGHAEVAQIAFDPKKISFEKLLDTFWEAHDPTTLNRQGADKGTQYRSVIFYHNEAQKAAAEKSKKAAQAHFADPIVTEISPLTKFYKAENYHQDYFRNNPRAPYCSYVIRPKLDKLDKKKATPGK